jgi:hypothetical protein
MSTTHDGNATTWRDLSDKLTPAIGRLGQAGAASATLRIMGRSAVSDGQSVDPAEKLEPLE